MRQRMSDEKLEQRAHTIAHLLANPIIRSMYPSTSRGKMYELFKGVYKSGYLAGLKAERERSKKLVEALRIYTNIGGFSGPAIEALKEYEKEGAE